ncbi:MAG: phosphatidate cytidylyltransferase [Candidatus Gastranaerophilaceae bacterium]
MDTPEKQPKKSKARTVTGFVVAATILFAMLCGGWVFVTALLLFVFLCEREYVEILKHKGFQPSLRIIASISFLLTAATVMSRFQWFLPITVAGIILSFVSVLFNRRQPYIANVSTTVFGFLLCWMPSFVFSLRNAGLPCDANIFGLWQNNVGAGYIIVMFFSILATDIGAYVFGTKFGKTKLNPEVSPKKTVEGAVAGGLCAVVAAIIFGLTIKMSLIQSICAGLLITLFAQIGDLSESLIKRDAGVKDSGDTLPGHGGFLDRADSYLLTAPVAYYFFEYFINTPFVIEIQKVLTSVGLT